MSEIALAADFAIIIVAAAVVGLLAKQTGQPTIIAYILTGLLLGPAVFGVITPSELTETMAELGLGFLLFLLGIKMRLDDVKDILRPIVNIAVLQTILQTALAFGIAWVLGFSLTETVIIALATVFGATPIIVKILTDKDEITSMPGKIDVGVLIVQDIYLVFVLALLGAGQLGTPTEVGMTIVTITVLISLIGLIAFASSRYLLPRLFRRIADNKDVFFLVAIAWAFLFILISEELNLSLEVGAFLAGMSIAQLPYSTELEDRVGPITDFFILVFFVAIGLQLEAADLFAFWREAIIASIVLMIGNFWIMFYLIDREDFSVETSFLGSLNMIQVSEFSLVVGGIAITAGFIDEPILGYLSLMALMTMSVSVYIINYNHQIYDRVQPFFSRWDSEEKVDAELPEYKNHAVVIGYDEITKNVLPILDREFEQLVVVDRKAAHREELERMGYDTVYGDFRHTEVRKAAGLKRASFVLSSTMQPEVNKALLAELSEKTTVFVEANWIDDARELYKFGAHYVIMSTHLTAERVSEYLELYFEDREEFDRLTGDDIKLLESYPEDELGIHGISLLSADDDAASGGENK